MSWDDDDFKISSMWHEHHIYGEKEKCEPLGVELDNCQKWDFFRFLDVLSIVQWRWHLMLAKKEVYLMEEWTKLLHANFAKWRKCQLDHLGDNS